MEMLSGHERETQLSLDGTKQREVLDFKRNCFHG